MRLLDVSDGETRWSESFEWEPSRIMQTGTDIANGALAAMSLPQVSRHDFSGTDNREAYDAFLLGKQRSAVVEELELAIADFQRAIELDRGYVRAYIALADTINWYLFNKGPAEKSRETWQERSRQALDTALKLDSESAAAISTLGRLSQDQDTALQLYRRSLALDPGYALSYYRLGRALRRSPDLVEAERLLRTAVDLDPLNASYRFGLGELLRAKGEEEKGLAEFEKSLELDPGLFQPYVDLGSVAHYRDGRIDDAIYFMRMAYSVNPQSGQLAAFVAGAYADLGMREEALAWKDQALQLSPTAHWVWSMAGMVHFRLGDSELGDEYDMRAVELLASDTLLTAQDYDFLSATVFAQNDIRNGHSESGLDRFRTAFPDASRKDVTVDFTNLKLVNEFATLLDMAGHHAEARHRWQRCVEFLRDFYVENTNTNKCPDCWQTYARLQLREETLAGMRRNIVDLNRRNDAWKLEEPFLDWLRGDPAFEELTGILTADLAQQRQRIRELECSGEMPAAPGIDFTPDCN
jgi:tetratricopeptide (TPR) repeat protein